MISLKAAVAAAMLLASSVLADVDPIVIKGSKFFYKTNGTEFFIRGVAYQTAVGGNNTASSSTDNDSDAKFTDPLGDSSICQRDIPYLTQLRTNTVRVYAIDTTKNHDTCMNALADAGIYVLADLSAPNVSINRADPTWDDQLYARYASVVDLMAKYSNTLGFFAGNEVANNASNADAIPFVKAAVRDMKAYIKQKNYRPMGVGYAADDGAAIRVPVRDYVNCGPAEASIDFFGYNIYSWCGPNTSDKFQTSGYADRTQEFANYSVPVFFAEYGCNQPSPRSWADTAALFGSKMSPVWSGGIVYEYFQEANDYGLVSVSGSSVSTLSDFANLKKAIATISPSGVDMGSYNPTNTVARACPAEATGTWSASTNLPPTPNEQLCSCMVQNLTCVAKSGIDESSFADLFDAACTSSVSCDGIAKNGTTGKYGAYSMCAAQEQLSWAFDHYYQQTGAKDTSCDFSGHAQKQQASVPSGCSNLLQQAGAAGTGMVTSAPSGTGAVGGGSSSSGVAAAVTVPAFDFGLLKLGLYVGVAFATGMGMILL